MKKLKIVSVFLCVLCLSLSLTGCCKKKALPGHVIALLNDNSGKIIKLGMYTDPMFLIPVEHVEFNSASLVFNQIHGGALKKNEYGQAEPFLAESFDTELLSDNSIALRLKWRSGLRWSDGESFSPKALEFTLAQIKNKALQSPYAELANDVLSIETNEEANTTKIVFKTNSKKYLDLLCVGLMPPHILQNATYSRPLISQINSKAKLATDSAVWFNYALKPVSMGAYAVKERMPGVYTLLEPNKYFYNADTAASSPNILLRTDFDYQQLMTDFRSDKYHWVSMPSAIAEQLEMMKLENVKIVRYYNSACMVLMFNTAKPVLNDVRFRKAVNLAINREAVKKAFAKDAKILFANPLASGTHALQDRGENKKLAARLLAEMGLKDTNNDGFIESAGKEFELELVYNDDNLIRNLIAKEIEANLADVGIRLKITAVSWADMIGKKMKPKAFDTALISLSLPRGGNWNSVLASDADENNNLNFCGVKNNAVDEALKTLDAITSSAAEQALAKKSLSDYLEAELPMLFLLKPCDIGLFHGSTAVKESPLPIWGFLQP